MSDGALIAVGAVIGLALGIVVSVTTDLPLAPEIGLAARGADRLAVAPRTGRMSEQTVAGLVLIATPLLFNAGFTLLAQRFDYPDILRRPTHEVLERFRAGGTSLVLIWWAFALSAVLFAALAVLLAIAVDDADPTVVVLGLVFGVLASVVQFLGLIRWPFLVPYLARVSEEAGPDSPRARRSTSSSSRSTATSASPSASTSGYAFTGIWSILAGVALIDSSVVADWLGVIGVVLGPLFLLCSLEFVGRPEDSGWKLAETLTPITYIAWSIWLIAVGVALLI